ncbi:MAG TPA: cellulase family glycosylhydrolase, partial [Planctomycetaceae bacterium]
MRVLILAATACVTILAAEKPLHAADMPWVVVSQDKTGFVLEPGGAAFRPCGFNYDHDVSGRLLEDYWDAEWPMVETHFAQMKKLGANVVRIHLQFGKFIEGPNPPDGAARPNRKSLERLAALVALAEKQRLYLDLTGLGCYHKQDVPPWYDALDEKGRWDAQAQFWQAIAAACAASPAIFCYDLMNEPVVPGGKRSAGDWLGPPFAGKHFVQVITLDQRDRPRPDIARQWIERLTTAIREKDKRHLVTVGLVDWSLDRPGLTSGFVPDKIAANLDFLCVHLYPETGKVDAALQTLAGFSIGKPVVIEETFPLKCSLEEFAIFVERSQKDACGLIGFYWGKPPEELRQSKAIV